MSVNTSFLYRIAFFFCGIALLYACSNDEQQAAENILPARHKAIALKFYDVFRTGDVHALDTLVSDDFVDHADTRDQGRDSLQEFIQTVYARSGGIKLEVLRQVADSNYVFSWLRYTNNDSVPSKIQRMQSVGVALFRDGQIIEHWEFAHVQDLVRVGGLHMPAADSIPR